MRRTQELGPPKLFALQIPPCSVRTSRHAPHGVSLVEGDFAHARVCLTSATEVFSAVSYPCSQSGAGKLPLTHDVYQVCRMV